MRPTVVTRLMLVGMMAVAAIGAVDAAAARSWDQVALFGALLVATAILFARTTLRRPLLPVRADLFRWLAQRAAVTGERTEHLADRALSAYRAGLVGDEGGPLGGDGAPGSRAGGTEEVGSPDQVGTAGEVAGAAETGTDDDGS